ncbi:hypothetical protein MLD38_034075 [Melastoma candidum]|uniref:Uncharacterized protein n=1 Tax=Melastoma candidum TaxID=119954 RepID=A0ACB9MD42_9MYRT|nr:hypothetical protein MLD38_034075 [Melastoma candidum]
MRESVDQAAGIEDGDKDWKKNRRRSNRRSKLPASSVSVSTSVSDCNGETATLQSTDGKVNSLPSTASDFILKQNSEGDRSQSPGYSSNSMPSAPLKEEVEYAGGGNFTKLCPESAALRGSLEASSSLDYFPVNGRWQHDRNKVFAPHWPTEVVEEALKRGYVFEALLRVNAYNRHEAYCKIDGVPVDILIDGFAAQNRAVEGDIVAVKVDPVSCWTRMKGSLGISTCYVPSEDVNSPLEKSENCGSSRNISKQRLEMDAKADYAGNAIHYAESDRFSSGKPCHLGLASSVPSVPDNVENGSSFEVNNVEEATQKICSLICTNPSKRPTGRVVSITKKSHRRGAVVGFLDVKRCFKDGFRKYLDKSKNVPVSSADEFIQITPIDNKFPKMVVLANELPDEVRKRLCHFDETVEAELVGCRIDEWNEDCSFPCANVVTVFGRGCEVKTQLDAILFENAICSSEFSAEAISCLPQIPWDIPQVELQHRVDLRNLCIFTIDPSTATDLDDALSIEVLANGIYRVGVHIADVSYFVQPNTPLDKEAQLRSTSVYMVHKKVPMLPPLLSEDLGSLNQGVDRLAFSIFWDINAEGNVIDRHLGRTVIHSCCKLSYEQAHDIIQGVISSESNDDGEESVPQVCGKFKLSDVISSVMHLHGISRILNENRLKGGALRLESPKVRFLLDEHGLPSDCFLSTRMNFNFLVEEFMLLANRTAAEVISRAFPDVALLRRHPEPNSRKLRDLGNFCSRHGLDLDTSSSGTFHKSLELAREKLKDDPVLFDILVLNATKSMQLASYFCTADYKDQEDKWGHYALAVPLYTHFTSPLRRYLDILVHRMLAAALEAESYSRCRMGAFGRCFSGTVFDKKATEESKDLREALSTAAMQHGVPSKEVLVELAVHCNERKLVSRNVKDATTKLYMWAFLRNKKNLLAEARVLAVGPRFVSTYIPKLAIERRIHYDNVDRLIVEWLEFTSTLVISLSPDKSRRSYLSKTLRSLEDVTLIIPTADEFGSVGGQKGDDLPPVIHPCVFPLTIQIMSTIPVALRAVGGDDGPIDISARLYTTSYL